MIDTLHGLQHLFSFAGIQLLLEGGVKTWKHVFICIKDRQQNNSVNTHIAKLSQGYSCWLHFHIPLALSHRLTGFQLYTWGQEEMQCMAVFLIVLQKWIPVAVSKNGTNTLGIRFSASVNWHSSIDVSGICIYTSWHLDAHLEKKSWVISYQSLSPFFIVLCVHLFY